jgi:hypothetical protein
MPTLAPQLSPIARCQWSAHVKRAAQINIGEKHAHTSQFDAERQITYNPAVYSRMLSPSGMHRGGRAARRNVKGHHRSTPAQHPVRASAEGRQPHDQQHTQAALSPRGWARVGLCGGGWRIVAIICSSHSRHG